MLQIQWLPKLVGFVSQGSLPAITVKPFEVSNSLKCCAAGEWCCAESLFVPGGAQAVVVEGVVEVVWCNWVVEELRGVL